MPQKIAISIADDSAYHSIVLLSLLLKEKKIILDRQEMYFLSEYVFDYIAELDDAIADYERDGIAFTHIWL